jgi:hypothetical protein
MFKMMTKEIIGQYTYHLESYAISKVGLTTTGSNNNN